MLTDSLVNKYLPEPTMVKLLFCWRSRKTPPILLYFGESSTGPAWQCASRTIRPTRTPRSLSPPRSWMCWPPQPRGPRAKAWLQSTGAAEKSGARDYLKRDTHPASLPLQTPVGELRCQATAEGHYGKLPSGRPLWHRPTISRGHWAEVDRGQQPQGRAGA